LATASSGNNAGRFIERENSHQNEKQAECFTS